MSSTPTQNFRTTLWCCSPPTSLTQQWNSSSKFPFGQLESFTFRDRPLRTLTFHAAGRSEVKGLTLSIPLIMRVLSTECKMPRPASWLPWGTTGIELLLCVHHFFICISYEYKTVSVYMELYGSSRINTLYCEHGPLKILLPTARNMSKSSDRKTRSTSILLVSLECYADGITIDLSKAGNGMCSVMPRIHALLMVNMFKTWWRFCNFQSILCVKMSSSTPYWGIIASALDIPHLSLSFCTLQGERKSATMTCAWCFVWTPRWLFTQRFSFACCHFVWIYFNCRGILGSKFDFCQNGRMRSLSPCVLVSLSLSEWIPECFKLSH